MNYLNKKFSARLLIAVAIAVSSSLSAFATTFKDAKSGLCFSTKQGWQHMLGNVFGEIFILL